MLLLLVCISPTIIWKLIWLSRTTVTNGKVWFVGHTLELNGSISNHLVVRFKAGNDSIQFNAPANLPFKEGDPVRVRYVPDEPSTARIDTPPKFLSDAILYSLWPLLVIVVIYFIPESLDPIIPRKSKIRLSRKKIIEIIRE